MIPISWCLWRLLTCPPSQNKGASSQWISVVVTLLSIYGHVYFRSHKLISNSSANFTSMLIFFFQLWLEFSNYPVALSFCVSSTFKKNAISQYITPRCRIHRWFISRTSAWRHQLQTEGKLGLPFSLRGRTRLELLCPAQFVFNYISKFL